MINLPGRARMQYCLNNLGERTLRPELGGSHDTINVTSVIVLKLHLMGS